jgi:hypothetical protein
VDRREPDSKDRSDTPSGEQLPLGALTSSSRHTSEHALEHVMSASRERSCLEALELTGTVHRWLVEGRIDLFRKPVEYWAQCLATNRERAWQIGDLVHLPKTQGSLFLFSDLEGHKPIVEEAFRKHRLVQRMIANNPNDQVYVVLMGDTIDRDGNQASEILEAMYDLQVHWGLSHNIYLLAGNHELDPDGIQRSAAQGGFFQEVCYHRESYQNKEAKQSVLGEGSKEMIDFMCEWVRSYYPDNYGCDELLVALWRVYNQVFLNSPKSIVTDNGLFISHAGITDKGPFDVIREGDCTTQPSIPECLRWLSLATYDPRTLEDVVWSDYTTDSAYTTLNKRGGLVDGKPTAGPGLAFGCESLKRFLGLLGDKTCMIRGHQVAVPEGCYSMSDSVWTNGTNLVTFNSARYGEYLEVPMGMNILSPEQITIHRS